MKKSCYVFFGLACLLNSHRLQAQPKAQPQFDGKQDRTRTDVALYGGFVHQHQNFFGKAFSFQGIEAGVVIEHKFLLAAYGDTFVSTLAIERANDPLFVYLGQYGLVVGAGQDNRKPLHMGCLINAGHFSLVGNRTDFKLFQADNPAVRTGGLVITPQVYGSVAVTKWMKFRLGIGYSVYRFDEQPQVTPSDLQNVAFAFGFMVGKFN